MSITPPWYHVGLRYQYQDTCSLCDKGQNLTSERTSIMERGEAPIHSPTPRDHHADSCQQDAPWPK